jgi:hypothetical protein
MQPCPGVLIASPDSDQARGWLNYPVIDPCVRYVTPNQRHVRWGLRHVAGSVL